ncbi:putative membrane protein [Herbihabitans rhizosphaerae]|uniref:Putative membrane protein n=1 Tax=Herbihabitans rhizosphaerae TaxID=1872711 RepID=A0A4Q7KF79_9PSEU|nr:PH domain-containing protein [Herbihabitans rhizosphaerae]RZS32176.1 putative membrane protein [Herbihabitans rhizosphaerae]
MTASVKSTQDTQWHPLDRRSLGVTAVLVGGALIGAGIPILIGMTRDDKPVGIVLAFGVPGVVLAVALAVLGDYLRWKKFSYRITGDRVESRTGILHRKHLSVHRDRIRSVDVTANPIYRAFGVAKVKIGTGQHGESDDGQVTLDPISRERADELRATLLDRTPTTATPTAVPTSDDAIATLDWKWIRYAPLSVWPVLLGAAAIGVVFKVADWFGAQDTVLHRAWEFIRDLPLWQAILLLVVVVLGVGLICTLGLYVEMWSNYRLEREPGPTLRLQRGFLTKRSVSLEERRLRGIEVVEPLGARFVGAARLEAVATGLAKKAEDEKVASRMLLPEAPLEVAHAVAADVLREQVAPTETVRLIAHPAAARGRRLRWALAGVAAVVVVLVVLGLTVTPVLLHIAWISAIVLTPPAVLAARDAYRNLGHGLSGDYAVTRHGVLARRTVALRRNGIIGWTVRQTPFQRRAGLITLAATTAAVKGAYEFLDMDAHEGVAFADDALPDVLSQFLEPVD